MPRLGRARARSNLRGCLHQKQPTQPLQPTIGFHELSSSRAHEARPATLGGLRGALTASARNLATAAGAGNRTWAKRYLSVERGRHDNGKSARPAPAIESAPVRGSMPNGRHRREQPWPSCTRRKRRLDGVRSDERGQTPY